MEIPTEIVYMDLVEALSKTSSSNPQEINAKTVAELASLCNLSQKTVRLRLQVLHEEGRLGHCKVMKPNINRVMTKRDAYYLIPLKDENEDADNTSIAITCS